MPQASTGSLKRSADLLLNDDREPARKRVSPVHGDRRPAFLQEVLNATGDVLLSPQAPIMASYLAGKVYQRLEKRGILRDGPVAGLETGEHLKRALSRIRKTVPRFALAAQHLIELSRHLVWQSGRSGPFASLNFEKAHAHAVIVGPGGMEERSDVRLGIILMAPYSRFPDHVQFHSRAFLLLSDAEVCIDDGPWEKAAAGTVFFNEAGCKFAMRCTAEPLLAIWCHIEDANL